MTEPEGPRPVPRPDWTPLPRAGCRNVEGKVLLLEEGLAIALLKFGAEGTIDEHAAGHEIDVVCIEGEGFISVEHRVYAFASGQALTWPAGAVHRLWTGHSAMVTLMVERLGVA